MRLSTILFSLCVAPGLAFAQGTNANIFANGLLNPAGDAEVGIGTSFIIVVDTMNDGFVPVLDASAFGGSINLNVGSFIDEPSGDDIVIRVGQYTEDLFGDAQATAGGQILYENGGGFDNLGQGDPFGIYWFPGLTGTESLMLNGLEFYGAFLGYEGEVLAGDSNWILPAANVNETYRYSSITGANGAGPDIPADQQVIIPEPSALAGVFGLAALLIARRRA
ncbi:MAG: PEP-CTERM sorting domain-containing protein [Opitutales bacterium]